MSMNIETSRIPVVGMTCAGCERRIEAALMMIPGVSAARATSSLSEVVVSYDSALAGLPAINDAIRAAGYSVREEKSKTLTIPQIIGLIAVIAALYLIVRSTIGLNFIPAVSQSMGFGLIFVVGLITSLHCIAMCGGISLSQTIARGEDAAAPASSGKAARIAPSLLYNGGRVISYTIVGAAAGAVGSVFSLSATLKGVMPIVAGVFMLFLGVRMLGIFPWLSRLRVRLPWGGHGGKGRAAAARRGPFFVGLLNGLMPCGPLQTMQVYALGTGSLLAGAFSMFLFSLGTVPLMLGFGAVSGLLSARFTKGMLRASGVLVAVLGIMMFTRGMNLFGVGLPAGGSGASAVARVDGGIQTVTTQIDSGGYHPFVVQKGIPVEWTITAKAEDLNGCNNPVTVPAYGIRASLVPGNNVIRFTPDREGAVTYTCWMGMISSTIYVVEDISTAGALAGTGPAALPVPAGAFCSGTAAGGCCGR